MEVPTATTPAEVPTATAEATTTETDTTEEGTTTTEEDEATTDAMTRPGSGTTAQSLRNTEGATYVTVITSTGPNAPMCTSSRPS